MYGLPLINYLNLNLNIVICDDTPEVICKLMEEEEEKFY
jgi:hypothetical protein